MTPFICHVSPASLAGGKVRRMAHQVLWPQHAAARKGEGGPFHQDRAQDRARRPAREGFLNRSPDDSPAASHLSHRRAAWARGLSSGLQQTMHGIDMCTGRSSSVHLPECSSQYGQLPDRPSPRSIATSTYLHIIVPPAVSLSLLLHHLIAPALPTTTASTITLVHLPRNFPLPEARHLLHLSVSHHPDAQ